MLTPVSILELVNSQLALVSEAVVVERIRALLVPPYLVTRPWDYGVPGEAYPCWTVLEHRPSNTGIAYSAQGFGPERPWGLVFLSGPHMSHGTDASWYGSLEDAFRESKACESPLPLGYRFR